MVPKLIATLAAHGDCVLFSAAIPFQGGHHHVNEQFLDYWIKLFAEHGYRPLDIVRGHIWEDASILWWLRQNCIVFCSDRLLEGNESCARNATSSAPYRLCFRAYIRIAQNDRRRRGVRNMSSFGIC